MPNGDQVMTVDENEVGERQSLRMSRLASNVVNEPSTFEPEPPIGPRIFIKLRPSTTYDTSGLQVLPDGMTVQLTSPGQLPRFFTSDGVLEQASSEDVFRSVVEGVVEGAMNGQSGILLSLGSEGSGQTFTFYGDMHKYENRGILPRAFEKMFQVADAKRSEINYLIRVGIVEVWRDKVRDLISLSPNDLKSVGDNGPKGMIHQPIECAEHAYALLIRALSGQKLFNQGRPHAKSHTIVFVDIEGQRILVGDEDPADPISGSNFKSRLTFAKIASIPQRAKDAEPVSARGSATTRNENVVHSDGCYFMTPTSPRIARARSQTAVGNQGAEEFRAACCSEKSGKLSEGISIRRDLLFLEQMFIRVSELHKLQRYYHKLQVVGMQGIMRNPNLAPSQYFRQNKLCHCLRDLVVSDNVRILLHLRPEAEYLPMVAESLRFVDRLRLIPRHSKSNASDEDKLNNLSALRQEIRTLREELERMAKSTQLNDEGAELSESRHALLKNQAEEFLAGNLDQLEVGSKAEANELFKNLRTLFQTAVAEKKSRRSVRSSKMSIVPISKEPRVSKVQSEKNVPKKARSQKSSASLKRKKGKKKHEGKGEPLAAVEAVETESALEVTEDAEEEEEAIEQQFTDLIGFASKEEALEAFRMTDAGIRLAETVTLTEALLTQKVDEHAAAVQVVTEAIKHLAAKQAELEAIQNARHEKGDEYDAAGNIIVAKPERDALIELRVLQDNREQAAEKLKVLKLELSKQKLALSSCKSEFETQFEIFCLDRLADVGNEGEESGEFLDSEGAGMGEADEEPTFCNLFSLRPITAQPQQPPAHMFDQLKRTAQEQAKAIVKYYQKNPPPWRN